MVILLLAWGSVYAQGGTERLELLTRTNLLFMKLSGVATELSWLCYFRALQPRQVSRVAPVNKLSVVLTIGLSVVVPRQRCPGRPALARP